MISVAVIAITFTVFNTSLGLFTFIGRQRGINTELPMGGALPKFVSPSDAFAIEVLITSISFWLAFGTAWRAYFLFTMASTENYHKQQIYYNEQLKKLTGNSPTSPTP